MSSARRTIYWIANLLLLRLVKQVQEYGIGRPAFEIQSQHLVERLQITGAPAATQYPEHRHLQQEPLI